MLTVYGIRNCDTVRKALKWLQSQEVAHTFHDIRTQPLPESTLIQWLAQRPWKELVNTRSTTWRHLPENEKSLECESDALRLLTAHPTLLKRPVITCGTKLLSVGFKPEQFAELYLNTDQGD